MTARKAPPEMFDSRLLRLRRARAGRRGSSFIETRCAADVADRLQDINRQFQNALVLGSADFVSALTAALPPEKTPLKITQAELSDEELSQKGSFDLIISVLNLHAVNDLPGALIQMRHVLKPDGLFIGSMFGGETLSELRSVLYVADESAHGGITARVYPFADYSQAAQLLQRTGYALPVVDSDRFQVNYKNWRTLISDLRDLGETSSLAQPTRKRFPLKAAEVAVKYASLDGKFSVSFEILWLTGWSPHETQQKPLKPGSAKMRLADALGTSETKFPKPE